MHIINDKIVLVAYVFDPKCSLFSEHRAPNHDDYMFSSYDRSRNVPQQHWRRSLRLWLWVIIFWNKLKAWNSEVTNECPINQERLLKISSQRSPKRLFCWLFWTCAQVFHYKYQQFSWYQYAYLFYLHQIKASYALFTKIADVVYLLSEF